MALVFAALSFTPSLLPRPAAYQGFVAGVDAAMGYALGVAGAWVWREYADRDARRSSHRARRAFAITAPVVLLVAILVGRHWQRQSAALIGTDPESLAAALLVPIVGVLVFVGLVALARALRTAYRKLAGYLDRHMGHRAARVTGIVVLAGALFLGVTGVLWTWAINTLDASLAVGDLTTPRDIGKPTTSLRSGGPDSLVSWDSLGRQGRIFVGEGPDAGDITKVTGRPAQEPIRIFTGTSSADTLEDQARLAVRDLDRAGGFDRRSLMVATTTGTGWVEPSASSSFEYLNDGDSAIVAMQYSHLPSWMSYLVDHTAARVAGRDLFDAVYDHWSRLPADHRPKLYVFGESLGSFGGENAFSGEADLANRTDGVLFVGPPSFNPLYREFVDSRDAGSPEIEPVYRDGRIIRFANRASDNIPPEDRPWTGTRVLYLQQPSDPITWWSPDLLWHRPDWLTEARGSDVSDSMRWIPVVTFWQVTADLALGFSTPPGHGHNFSGEHVDGWNAILQPQGWTPEMLDLLRAQLRRE
ncbi:alpha/beta-hydrolase family protein [Marmoricola sp. URHB0036]|uniref:alpha/beta hydrolase n=1 Tax=Marmoricola sp. URHB0036 TaxID=1298863 RepID=UPI00042A5DA7|nr:alpha/beta-hydrolase family protein [Marmoricola sp. URHB0036]